MRLIFAVVFASLSSFGTANASSIIILGDAATSPSSVTTAGREGASVIEIGTPAIDSGKVAAVDAKMGPAPMIMRGGEVGSVSAEPAAVQAPSAEGSSANSKIADGSAQGTPTPVTTK